MIFTDPIFFFAFLPVWVILTYCCSEDWSKNAVSLLGSLLFIAWGKQWYYALILVPVFLVYICGRLIPKFGPAAEIFGDIFAVGSGVAAVIFLPDKGTLVHGLMSVGFILYILRGVSYLKSISEGMEPEKNFLPLAVYLIALENMLIAPLENYDDMRDNLNSRRPVLTKASAGICMLIKGFAVSAVLGLSLDSVRLATVQYEAFPWINALTLPVVSLAEAVVMTSGILMMSGGISLILGYSLSLTIPAVVPHARFSELIGEIWHTFPQFVISTLTDRPAAVYVFNLIITAGLTLLFVFFDCLPAAVLCVVIFGVMISSRFSLNKGCDVLLSVIFVAICLIIFAGAAPGGLGGFISALDISKYDYDITFILNRELTRRAVWIIVAVLAVSPLPRLAAGRLRKCMGESEKTYTVVKIAETVFCAALLIVSAAASLR